MALSRLDKIVSLSGERTRSEAAKLIRAGLVSVDGIVVKSPAHKADRAAGAVCPEGIRFPARRTNTRCSISLRGS